MAYDELLAARIRSLIEGEPGVSEKRMFGGLGFLIDGHIAVSASGQGGLMVGVDPAQADALLASPHAARTVMHGRAMDGWLRVGADGLVGDPALRDWVAIGVGVARGLPPKDR